MGSINGFASSITGTTGSTNALEPKVGWRIYICPRCIHASANGSASPIVADSTAAAARIAVNDWFQVGTDVAKIRQCSAVAGTSFAYSGTAISVTAGDRIVVIGTTQPSVTGSSATYTPNTLVYSRDDDASTAVTNSMVTSDANGGYQFWASDNQYDLIVQDNTQACRDIVEDVIIGRAAGDLIPDTPHSRLIGNTASPWGSIYHAGEIISGITGAAGVTYHSYDTTGGWTQGNLWGLALNNATKVYGDTHGGIFQSWSLPQVFNVKSAKYGAIGDNSTDDTAAIQNALNDAALAVSGTSGGCVFLPRGVYIVNSTLTLPTKVRITREGRNATVIKVGGSFTFNGTTDAVVRIGSASENAHGSWIENLQIDCNDVANSIAVYSTRVNEPSGLRNVTLIRFILYGIYFSGTTTANFTIRDCELYCSDSATSSTKGMWIEDSTGASVIDRCTVGSYSATVSVGTAIHADHGVGWLLSISNCNMEMGSIGIRQTINGLRVSSCTSGGGCLVLFARDSGITDTVVIDIRATGGAIGFSDSQTGFTSDSMALFSATNNANTISMPHSLATGHTWTLQSPMSLSGIIKNSNTVIGANASILTAGTVLTLGPGNIFGISSAPAGATTVTSIAPLNNGRRVTLIGQAGTITFANGTGLRTAAPAVAAGESVEFACWGTTWTQCAPKMT